MEFGKLVKIRKELFDNALPPKSPSGRAEVKVKPESKEGMDIEPNPCWEGYEPIGLKEDGSPNCVPIKASKEKFVIPTPESNEEQDKYISRCISSIIDEYGQEQASAICYSTWEKK